MATACEHPPQREESERTFSRNFKSTWFLLAKVEEITSWSQWSSGELPLLNPHPQDKNERCSSLKLHATDYHCGIQQSHPQKNMETGMDLTHIVGKCKNKQLQGEKMDFPSHPNPKVARELHCLASPSTGGTPSIIKFPQPAGSRGLKRKHPHLIKDWGICTSPPVWQTGQAYTLPLIKGLPTPNDATHNATILDLTTCTHKRLRN